MKVNLNGSIPEPTKAVRDAEGPGMISTATSCSIASLTAKYEGESTTKVETICGVGSDEVQLVANVNAQSFTKTYYLWQKKVGNGKWVPLTEQEGSGENKSTLNVTLTSTHTEYRVVVANSKEDAEKADTESVCGMAAITNIVSVGCNNMDLSIESTKASICENDNGEYSPLFSMSDSQSFQDRQQEAIIEDSGEK